VRVLVCGGRTYADREALFRALDDVHMRVGPVTLIMHGGATGADRLGEAWAKAHGIAVDRYPAEWRIWGPSAGPRRNQHMLETGRPDLVVAFEGNRGTADMVRRARAANVDIIEVPPRAQETS
jgi:hypothetical protein